MRPKDLMIQAASIDFDLQHYMNQNLIIVVRVAPPSDLYEVSNPDEFLAEYMNDIITVVKQYQPNKIVFDELTPFIGFNNIQLLQSSFTKTSEEIEDSGITSLFILGDPATPAARSIVDSLTSFSTGIIYLNKFEETIRGKNGEIVITPNIGHTEGQFKSKYQIEPYKGVTIDFTGSTGFHSVGKIEKKNDEQLIKNVPQNYKSLADMDTPNGDIIPLSYYPLDDFKLILNNQIALYKSTGQVFTILSFHFDQTAEEKGLLTLIQLQNAIRLSTEKKDKICLLSNKVIVLLVKEERENILSLISKIKSNLPSQDKDYIKETVKYISVCAVKVDETVQNADDIFEQLITDNPAEKNRLYFQY